MGIGWGLCESLAAGGLDLVIVGCEKDLAQQRAEELTGRGHQPIAVTADLTHVDEPSNVAANILEQAGRCDVPVNNAGEHTETANVQRFAFEGSSRLGAAVVRVSVPARRHRSDRRTAT